MYRFIAFLLLSFLSWPAAAQEKKIMEKKVRNAMATKDSLASTLNRTKTRLDTLTKPPQTIDSLIRAWQKRKDSVAAMD
jgi:hypothetical protein